VDLGQRGRREAFVAFVRAEQSRLLRVAFLMCGDWHRAEDIVQTALTQVYARWDRVDLEAGAWSYARRAVINVAIDETRRPWRREVLGAAVPDPCGPSAPGFDDDLLAALGALAPRQRAVVVLRYIEDLEVEVVASMLGVSAGTVKSQAARGLGALRTRLGRSPAETVAGTSSGTP
jgi:RNA polymerase sigma-70 factor (sigma-E family)